MAIYVLLGSLTDEGAEKIRQHPEWIQEVNQDLDRMGVKVIAQYAVLGPYDLVNIVEAPDNKTVVRVSTQLSLRGSVKITSMPAISIEDFIASLR
ncbi:MAG: GYD domain-containing protein [Anaerolineales bacterium]|nr:GYD domain-containing protein [Anaerolineales bacterium]